MMLSRVAQALYWIGRYLERAENVTRLLRVTSELSQEVEGLDDHLAQSEWDSVVAAFPGIPTEPMQFSPETGLSIPYIKMLLLDPDHPVSARHSLGRARDNARSAREAITQEMFVHLNEAYRNLESHGRKRMDDPTKGHDMVGDIHRQILTTLGAIENTFTRDQGWSFLKLGEAMERTQRTLMLLRSKTPALRSQDAMELPLVYARWRSLLRCLASLENFRQAHGARLDSASVIRFLLFDPAAPRSVLCGVARMNRYIQALPVAPDNTGQAQRLLGKLLATVTYDESQILAMPDLEPFFDESMQCLSEAHDAIAVRFFPA